MPPKRPDLLAKTIITLKNDTSLRQHLIQAGIETIQKKFTIERQVHELEYVYKTS